MTATNRDRNIVEQLDGKNIGKHGIYELNRAIIL